MRLSMIIVLGATILSFAAPAGLASDYHQPFGAGSAGRPAPAFGIVCSSGPDACMSLHAGNGRGADGTLVRREPGDLFQPHRRGDVSATAPEALSAPEAPEAVSDPHVVSAPGGFDIEDAAVGAGIALALALLLALGLQTIRHGRPLAH